MHEIFHIRHFVAKFTRDERLTPSGDSLKGETCFFECFISKCVRCDLIEKGYTKGGELRGIDAGHEVLQVFADPFEHQLCENGENRASRWRRAFALPVMERPRGWNPSLSDPRLINVGQ